MDFWIGWMDQDLWIFGEGWMDPDLWIFGEGWMQHLKECSKYIKSKN